MIQMNETTNGINHHRQCPWALTIENCNGVQMFRTFLIIGAILYLMLTLILLTYYIYNSIKQNEKFYKIISWTSLNYMKFWSIIYFSMRCFHCITIIFNLFGDNIIFRDTFFLISWIPGHLLVYIHIVSIFRILPSLLFNQFTETTSRMKTIWIPKGEKQITIIFWAFCIITVLSLTTTSFIAAFIRRSEGFTKKWFFAFSTHVFFQWLYCLINGFLFLYYGRILVKQTKKSIKLTDINNDKGRENFRVFIRKMKMYNFVCSAICFFTAIIVLPSTTLLMYLGLDNLIDIMFCIAVNIIFPILFGMLSYSIITSETQNNNTDEPSFTHQYSTYMQTNSFSNV
ncbi:unnamed protein product [Rhizophagus irregularis]